MVRLAEMYDQGLGVRKDPARAQELYARAAQNGFGPAQAKAQLPGPVSAPARPAAARVAAASAPVPAASVQPPPPILRSNALPSSVVSSPLVVDERDRRGSGRRERPAAPVQPSAPPPPSPPLDPKTVASLSPQDSQRFQAGVVAFQAGQATDAFKLWRGLAEKGVAEAQFRIADMFEYGRGVGRDPIEAYRWYRAAASAHEMAAAAMTRLSAQLTAAERAIAESMAAGPARTGTP
jgi:hypothetical protein